MIELKYSFANYYLYNDFFKGKFKLVLMNIDSNNSQTDLVKLIQFNEHAIIEDFNFSNIDYEITEIGRTTYRTFNSAIDDISEIITEGKYKGMMEQTYHAYSLLWNETKTNIDISNYNHIFIKNYNQSSYYKFPINEGIKQYRKLALREYNLNLLTS